MLEPEEEYCTETHRRNAGDSKREHHCGRASFSAGFGRTGSSRLGDSQLFSVALLWAEGAVTLDTLREEGKTAGD